MPEPITAVLFDFHSTLVDQGDSGRWLAAAWARTGEPGSPLDGLGEDRFRRAVDHLNDFGVHFRQIDPDHSRDLGAEQHWQVFQNPVVVGDLPDRLVRPLWETHQDHWMPYDDAAPVLVALRAAGVKVGVLSNIGTDLSPTLRRGKLDHLVDTVTQSWQVGAVKPDPRIFRAAMEALDADPAHTLMVGDSWAEDGAAAALGIRTLILPRTHGPVHGLHAVLRLMGL